MATQDSSTSCVRSPVSVGDQVSYYQAGKGRHGAGGGWRFGRVIGLHCDNIGINPSGLEMATVRFPELNSNFPAGDQAIARFLLRKGGVA